MKTLRDMNRLRVELLHYRQEHKLTRKLVAETLGLPLGTLTSYELGSRRMPHEVMEVVQNFLDEIPFARFHRGEIKPGWSRPRRKRRRHTPAPAAKGWFRNKHLWNPPDLPTRLKLWRALHALDQGEASRHLGFKAPSTVCHWEHGRRAPGPETQARLLKIMEKDMDTIDKLLLQDDARRQLEAPDVEDRDSTPGERDEFKRLRAVMEDVARGALKLEAHPLGLCRIVVQDGFVVMRSLGTKSYYALAVGTASFFRSKAPDTCRMQRCSPREVIEVDRKWLELAVDAAEQPVRDKFHARWTPGAATKKDTEKKGETTKVVNLTNAMQGKAPQPPAAPRPNGLGAGLGISVSEVRCTVLVEREKTLELRLDQVLSLLTQAGAKPAPSSTILPWGAGFRVLSEDESSVQGACYDEIVKSERAYAVGVTQLAALLAQVGVKIVTTTAKLEVTEQGYVRVRWVEQSEEQR